MNCFFVQRDTWHMSEEAERGRSTCVFHVDPKYNHKCPCKLERSVTSERKGHKQGGKIEMLLLGVKKYCPPQDMENK